MALFNAWLVLQVLVVAMLLWSVVLGWLPLDGRARLRAIRLGLFAAAVLPAALWAAPAHERLAPPPAQVSLERTASGPQLSVVSAPLASRVSAPAIVVPGAASAAALAAYNMGPEAVQRAIDATGTRDPWELTEEGAINEYAAMIMAGAIILADPSLVGR